ncbi:MAG: CRTAC1 family protein, partial [Limisphaerales bacterium]
WQGMAVGDFDADGRLDFVASNWGRNSKYSSGSSHPVRLYSGDFDADGTFDVIESHFEAALGKYVPDRQRGILGASLPFVNERYRTHAAYSTAGVDEILGDGRGRAAVAEANWFDSTLFLNRGDHFEARAFPIEAQFAPAFGISVADFDNDSHEDIVLAQNFFAVTPETPRHDAGRSLLLRGDGKGNFQPVAGQESGLLVYGEQRSVSTADFDHDGRTDFVLTQNGAAVKLYRNRTPAPGVRIKLQGSTSNPDAIGASMRMINGNVSGPRRAVAAGSGYASQNAFVQVLPRPAAPATLEVTWPGGKRSSVNVLPGQNEVRAVFPSK